MNLKGGKGGKKHFCRTEREEKKPFYHGKIVPGNGKYFKKGEGGGGTPPAPEHSREKGAKWWGKWAKDPPRKPIRSPPTLPILKSKAGNLEFFLWWKNRGKTRGEKERT